MEQPIKFFVGLDVHKDRISVAVCEPGCEPSRFIGMIRHDLTALLKVLSKYGDSEQVGVTYEAGPTGYGLYRALEQRGFACEVIAPSLTPRRTADRVKNDRRDSTRLAELFRAGELRAIWVPDEQHEAMRNLWRAREDAVDMRLKARQQLKSFLLRQGRVFAGKTAWSRTHHSWIADQRFEQPADQIALSEYQLAVDIANARVQRLTEALTHAAARWRFEPVIAALRALRGIDSVSAIGLLAGIGDIGRFDSPAKLMGYLGLVPSEHSSGNTVRRGSITKTGNAHARQLLTEAAWNYRFAARLSRDIRHRQQDLPEAVRHHAWKAQLRLCTRFARLHARGVQKNKACVAIARELSGFVWAIARMVPPSAAVVS